MKTNSNIKWIYIKTFLIFLCCAITNGNAQTLSFTDITGSAIGDTQYYTHGTAFADVTGDNRPDLYITRYGNVLISERFYRNTDGSVFSERASTYGITDTDYGSHGHCFADFDNDGDYDLLNGTTVVRAYNGGPVTGGDNNNLYRNNTNTNFTDVTFTSMLNRKMKTRATLALDMDNNGYLDIFTVTGYQGTSDPAAEDNEIYMNYGSWTFSAVTSGVLYNAPVGQGATDTDYDGDGDIDIISANRTGALNILRNNGTGTFTQITATSIGINHRAEDGITMGDVDNDGDLDMVLVSADPSEAYLYYNKGDGTFEYNSEWWVDVNGYMGGFADLDNDGDLDLIFAGDTKYLLNDGLGDLNEDPSYTINYDSDPPIYDAVNDPRAIAFSDIDDDGDVDFAFGDKLAKGHIIRNDLSSTNHYLKVNLVSPQGQAGAFGAKAYVYAGGNMNGTLLGFREARSNNGYCGQNDPVLHFGMGSNTTADVLIEFLDGTVATRTNIAVDQTVTIDRSDIMLELLVFLEGPYDASDDTMSTALKTNDYIPTTSPYSEDPRSVASIPDDIVDWVLIELRETASGAAVASKSAFLRKNGHVVGDDGTTEYITMDASVNSYYIVIKHRNHLTVMSASAIALNSTSSTLYNFSSAAAQNYGSGVKELETNVFGLYAGNANASDQEIYPSDLASIRINILAGTYGYHVADINLDSEVYPSDYAMSRLNLLAGAYSSAPNP